MGDVVQSLKGTSGDKFNFRAPGSGMYNFCFHNPHSKQETVSFYVHVGHIPTDHDLAKDGFFQLSLFMSFLNMCSERLINFLLIHLCIFLFLLMCCVFVPVHLNPVNVKIAELREALESVTAEQKFLKARDARHRLSKQLYLL